MRKGLWVNAALVASRARSAARFDLVAFEMPFATGKAVKRKMIRSRSPAEWKTHHPVLHLIPLLRLFRERGVASEIVMLCTSIHLVTHRHDSTDTTSGTLFSYQWTSHLLK